MAKKENKTDKKIIKSKKKVIEKNDNKIIIEELKNLLELAKEGKIETFLFAGYTPEGEMIITDTCDTLIETSTLVSFLQTANTARVIAEMIDSE